MYRKFGKRAGDIALALALLPVTAIISLPIALLIKREDGGQVLFRGERLGRKMKPFQMYKFRTMVEGAEDIRNEDGSTYNAVNDPRLTKVGRFLRKTSLDELPQVLNVLKGEMSFVGPRPSPLGNQSRYPKAYIQKFSVLPGITGYHQVLFRNSGDFDDRMDNDLYYVKHLSPGLDFKILLQTLAKVLKRSDIHRNK